MTPALLGRKVGMTRIYDDKGAIVAVTVVEAGPCAVTQVKTVESDGYNAVQLGFKDIKAKFSTFGLIGHAAKAGVGPKRHFREIRLKDATDKKPGDEVKADIFEGVQYVDVIGVSKGKGFAGVMKRHHFGGQPGSHGTERKHRSPGGIGAMAGDRGRGRSIKKGKKMAGHMGDAQRTARNQKLVSVDTDRNLLVICGAVPGPDGGYVLVRQSKTKK